MTFTYPGGQYRLTNQEGKEATVYLTSSDARTFSKFFGLKLFNLSEISFVKEMHPTDIKKYQRLFNGVR